MQHSQMAKKLAAQGRGKDKYLLHITKDELEALESTGKVTYNPRTGLPEAGFFSSLLSIAAPIVGSIFGGPVGGAIGGAIGSGIKGGNVLAGAAAGGLGSWAGQALGGALGGTASAGSDIWGGALGDFGADALTELGTDFVAGAGSVLPAISSGGFDSWFDTSPLSFGAPSYSSGPLGLGEMSPLTVPMGGSEPSMLERLRRLPWKGIAGGFDVAKSLYGLSQAQKLQQLAQQYGERADPYGPYRAQSAERLAQLQANPALLAETPGYQAGLQAVQRGLAGSGYLGSGNEKVALLKYGGDIYNQETARLAQLAGAQFSPANAGQIGMTGAAGAANLRGNTLNNIARNIYGWGTS